MKPAPACAYIRFYAELNDHLPPEQQYQTLEKSFFVPASVKDIIESFGVPHAEVELILANSQPIDFSHVARDGDRISVYPMFESLDLGPQLRVRPEPLRHPKFVLDVHLGKLAAYVRMLGFDTLYQNCCTDAELVRISTSEHRILLTRARGLLMYNPVTHGYWLRHRDSHKQVAEIVERFDLRQLIRPFTRCMACNEVLETVAPEQVRHLVPSRTAELYNEFRRCPQCARVYWKGSHYVRMQRWIEELKGGAPAEIPIEGSISAQKDFVEDDLPGLSPASPKQSQGA